MHNRIVISTIHYPQIEGIKYIKTERSIKGFEGTLRRIMSMREEELMNYANQSEIVQKRFNPNVWKEWMTKIEKSSLK